MIEGHKHELEFLKEFKGLSGSYLVNPSMLDVMSVTELILADEFILKHDCRWWRFWETRIIQIEIDSCGNKVIMCHKCKKHTVIYGLENNEPEKKPKKKAKKKKAKVKSKGKSKNVKRNTTSRG